MAASANLVRDNFAWRIESITPTATEAFLPPRFAEIDVNKVDVEQASGLARKFTLQWRGSDEDNDALGSRIADDESQRLAAHTWIVAIYYPIDKVDAARLERVILQDRHDVLKLLRSPASFAGYSAAQPSASVGIYNRIRIQDEIDRDSERVWSLRTTWRTLINETEV